MQFTQEEHLLFLLILMISRSIRTGILILRFQINYITFFILEIPLRTTKWYTYHNLRTNDGVYLNMMHHCGGVESYPYITSSSESLSMEKAGLSFNWESGELSKIINAKSWQSSQKL